MLLFFRWSITLLNELERSQQTHLAKSKALQYHTYVSNCHRKELWIIFQWWTMTTWKFSVILMKLQAGWASVQKICDQFSRAKRDVSQSYYLFVIYLSCSHSCFVTIWWRPQIKAEMAVDTACLFGCIFQNCSG